MNNKPKMMDIVTTKEILEAVRTLNSIEGLPDSDYYIAKVLQIHTSTMSGYTKDNRVMSDEIGVKAAKLLGWDAELVLQCLCLEASNKLLKGDVSKVWQDSLNAKFAAFPLLFVALGAIQFLQSVGSTV